MALTQAIEQAKRRRRQLLAELRVDEQLDIEAARGILDGYRADDAAADSAFESLCKIHFSLLDSEEQRDSFARVFAEWQRDEAGESRYIEQALSHNVAQLSRFRSHTPAFVSGSYVPDGSEPVA